MEQQLKELFTKNKGYLHGKTIRGNRTLYYQLKAMLADGNAIQVKRGLYRCPELAQGDSWGEVCKGLPLGVICLFSAWQFYELTTTVAGVVHVAIPAKKKYQLPDFPPVKLYYWTEKFYEIGIVRAMFNNEVIQIYDLEKSVCDAVRYRNKVGVDITTEVLRNYLKKKDRNLDKLMKYAEKMRISSVMQQYIQMML